MTCNPVSHHSQELVAPAGQVIGFVDTKEQFDAAAQALEAGGYADSSIIVLQAKDGVDLLERLQRTFNFSDGEDAVIEFSIKELRAGHYALAIQAKDREAAVRVVSLLEPLGVHSFSYFGTWVNERLTH